MLVPRKVEGRYERLLKNNLKFLQQEVIHGDIQIDENYDFKKEHVRVRMVVGEIRMLTSFIPEWLEDVFVDGNFMCKKLILPGITKNLLHSPKNINGHYDCSCCGLVSLFGAPECIGGTFHCQTNDLLSLEFLPKKIYGTIYASHNKKFFNESDIPKDSSVGKLNEWSF